MGELFNLVFLLVVRRGSSTGTHETRHPTKVIGECLLGACLVRAHRMAMVRCLGLRYGFAHLWSLPMRTRLVTVSLGAYVHKSLAQIEWQLESGAPDCAPYTHTTRYTYFRNTSNF